ASYVQVAAFSNPRSAKMTVEQIGPRYPVAVLPQRGTDHSIYRIFVGPLSEDEKGSALYAIRNRGFRDAFVREQP
ncbi:MAG: SPOR domain-containing protein, partial [Alkalispirochaeta sp.]